MLTPKYTCATDSNTKWNKSTSMINETCKAIEYPHVIEKEIEIPNLDLTNNPL